MANSIIQDEEMCFICGRRDTLEEHHIVFGNPGRMNSEKYGIKVMLCKEHHTGSKGVHHGNHELDIMLKKIGQREFEKIYSRRKWMEVFGKNYLLED